QIQLEGTVLASGGAVSLGQDHIWQATIHDPNGRADQYGTDPYQVTTGSHLVFGVNAGGMTPSLIEARQQKLANGTRYPILEGLQQAAMHFWLLHDQYDHVAASSWGVHVYRMPSVGMFLSKANVTYRFGLPNTIFFNGFTTDVKRVLIAATSVNAQRQVAMMAQAGGQGSM